MVACQGPRPGQHRPARQHRQFQDHRRRGADPGDPRLGAPRHAGEHAGMGARPTQLGADPRRPGGSALPVPAHRGRAVAMNAALKALAEATLGTAAVAAAWTAGASCAFLGIAGLWGHPLVPATDYLWGWWRYLPYAGRNTTVTL